MLGCDSLHFLLDSDLGNFAELRPQEKLDLVAQFEGSELQREQYVQRGEIPASRGVRGQVEY